MSTSNRTLVESILEFYDIIKPKNPNNSYTVLAAVSNTNSNRESNLIALASGTQANLGVYSDDIKDCHAESIVKRAYKRYLINILLEEVNKSKDLKVIQKFIDEKLQNQNLTLFISQFPCGFLKRYEGDEPIDKISGKLIKRKPGRGTFKDGNIVYVEKDPCCDKLRRWLREGLQGKKLKHLFGIEGKITKILIGNCENDLNFDYHVAVDKLKRLLLEGGDNELLSIEIVDIVSRPEFVFNPEQQAQPVSIAWWYGGEENQRQFSNSPNNVERIVDGRRIGLTNKLLANDLDRDKLKIANYWLRRDLNHLEHLLQHLHQ